MRRWGALVAAALLTSCAAPGAQDPGGPGASSTVAATEEAPVPAREGRVATSQRVTFVPQQVRLPGAGVAEVRPASTRAGVLDVPLQVDRVGWWDGSAQVGDPYGSTVLAGHVDSREQGVGFFAGLLEVEVGDEVEVLGDGRSASYRVTEVQEVPKEALATTSAALDQRGPHRLVLITCTGAFDPVLRSYDDNLVVTAVPVAGPG